MLEFLARWLFRRRDTAARAQEAASKAWLDDLRQNELSLSARRRLAPEEPVKAPGIAHGSAEAVTEVDRLVAGFSQQAPARNKAKADYAEDDSVSCGDGVASDSAPSNAGSEAGGAFGGGGADAGFGGTDSGGASGDSGDNV